MSIEAMKLALEALEAVSKEMTVGERYTNAGQQVLDAIDHLRVATTQQPATRLPEDVVIGHVTLCKGSNISLLIEYAKRLNADVERLEAQQPATSEPVVSRNPFASRCYTMSESHLSGHRLIVGFEKLGDAQDAHEWIARYGRCDYLHLGVEGIK